MIEIAIFLMIPFLVYLGETNAIYLEDTALEKAYTYSFGLLIICVLLLVFFKPMSNQFHSTRNQIYINNFEVLTRGKKESLPFDYVQ